MQSSKTTREVEKSERRRSRVHREPLLTAREVSVFFPHIVKEDNTVLQITLPFLTYDDKGGFFFLSLPSLELPGLTDTAIGPVQLIKPDALEAALTLLPPLPKPRVPQVLSCCCPNLSQYTHFSASPRLPPQAACCPAQTQRETPEKELAGSLSQGLAMAAHLVSGFHSGSQQSTLHSVAGTCFQNANLISSPPPPPS